ERWAVYVNVHGKSRRLQNLQGLLRLILFFVFAYVCGSAQAWLIPSGRRHEHRARPGSVCRFFVIFVTAVFAGFCLWAMATRMFLDHKNIEFTLRRPCEAIQIPSGEKMALPPGSNGVIKRMDEGTYTVGILGADQAVVRIAEK